MNIQRTCRPYRWARGAWTNTARSYSQIVNPSLQSRETHRRPILKNERDLVQNGYEGLMSADGLQKAWFQYQDFLLDKIKLHTVGDTLESMPIQSLVVATARDPAKAALFNYASMAYNNHFFFKNLAMQGRSLPIPGPLQEELVNTFGSISTLRRLMLETANSMFGPGFVWLVQHRDRYSKKGQSFAVMNTYIAGSPLPGAHYRKQSVDLNNQASKDEAILESALSPKTAPKEASFQNRSTKLHVPPGGIAVNPILCVNTWEHVWMFDWGIAGKEKYLESWWESIDWDIVNATHHRAD